MIDMLRAIDRSARSTDRAALSADCAAIRWIRR